MTKENDLQTPPDSETEKVQREIESGERPKILFASAAEGGSGPDDPKDQPA